MSAADNRLALLQIAADKRASSAYRDGIQGLLTHGKYQDFIVCCGDRSWKVHRAFICSQSKYFAGLCDGDFKVLNPGSGMGTTQAGDVLKESQEHKINLQDDDPAIIELMVQFLYTLHYPASSVENETNGGQDLLTNAKLYAIADKYDILSLKDAVVAAFTEGLYRVSAVENATPMSFLAELISIVYESTPDSDRQLREPLQVFFRSCPWTILGRKSVMDYAREHNNFAYDILVHVVKGNKTYHRYRYWCSYCFGYNVADSQGRCKNCEEPLEEF